MVTRCTSPDRRWILARKIALEDVDPLLVQMLIAYEDKRFISIMASTSQQFFARH